MPPRSSRRAFVGPAVGGEDDAVVGPLRADDVQGPAVWCGAVQAAAEEPGDTHRRAPDRAEPGAGELRRRVRSAGVGLWVPVTGDLLTGDRVEESMADAGHDHDEVVPAVGMDGEADAEQTPDGGPVVQHRLPRLRGRHDRGGDVALAQLLLVLRDSSGLSVSVKTTNDLKVTRTRHLR